MEGRRREERMRIMKTRRKKRKTCRWGQMTRSATSLKRY